MLEKGLSSGNMVSVIRCGRLVIKPAIRAMDYGKVLSEKKGILARSQASNALRQHGIELRLSTIIKGSKPSLGGETMKGLIRGNPKCIDKKRAPGWNSRAGEELDWWTPELLGRNVKRIKIQG
jgi:hypothetical protein